MNLSPFLDLRFFEKLEPGLYIGMSDGSLNRATVRFPFLYERNSTEEGFMVEKTVTE